MAPTDHSGAGHDDDRRDQEDRVVSRRVDPDTSPGTAADAADERAYAAAQSESSRSEPSQPEPRSEPGRPEPDGPQTSAGGSGGTAERASADLDSDAEDQPTRSE